MQSSQTYWTKSRRPREDNWIPQLKSPSFYQELEARKAADLNVNVDPEVLVTTNTEELHVSSGTFRGTFPLNLWKNAEKCGFSRLRKVQNAAVTYIDAGYTVYLATTARSGKTVGYMLPVIQKVSEDLKSRKHVDRHPRAIITTYCMEETKYVYETLLGLVADTNINVALYNGQTNTDSINEKDRADILVTTIKWVIKLVNEEWMSLEYLKFFVVDSTDELLSYRNIEDEDITRRMFKIYDQQALNSQLILVASDESALDCQFWEERTRMDKKWVVLKNEQRISPSNHLLVRVIEKAMPHAVLESIRKWDKGQVLVVVHSNIESYLIRCQQIQKHLERHGIHSVLYNTKLTMIEKDAILSDFITHKNQVLIMKYSYPTRVIRAPNIKQVIHVSIPSYTGEQHSASYHFSSGSVSFVPNARSVVLLNVEEQKELYGKKLGRITDCIQDCSSSVDWPHNFIPPWAAKYQGSWALRDWDESDKEGLEDFPDLVQGSQAKRKVPDNQGPVKYSSKPNEDYSFNEGSLNHPQQHENQKSESRVPQRFEDSFSYSDNSDLQSGPCCQKDVRNTWEPSDGMGYCEDPSQDRRPNAGSENTRYYEDSRQNDQDRFNRGQGFCECERPPRQYQQNQFQNDNMDGRYQRPPQNYCEPLQQSQTGASYNECQQNRYNPNQQRTRYNEYEQPLRQNMQRMQMSEGQNYNNIQQTNFRAPSQGNYQQPMGVFPQGGCQQCTCSLINQNYQYGERTDPRGNYYQQPMNPNLPGGLEQPRQPYQYAPGGCQDATRSSPMYRNPQNEQQQGSYCQQPRPRPQGDIQQCCRPGPNAQYSQRDGPQGNRYQGNDGCQIQNSPRNTNSVPNIVPGNRFAHRRKPEGSQKETIENRPVSGNRQEGNQGNFNRW